MKCITLLGLLLTLLTLHGVRAGLQCPQNHVTVSCNEIRSDEGYTYKVPPDLTQLPKDCDRGWYNEGGVLIADDSDPPTLLDPVIKVTSEHLITNLCVDGVQLKNTCYGENTEECEVTYKALDNEGPDKSGQKDPSPPPTPPDQPSSQTGIIVSVVVALLIVTAAVLGVGVYKRRTLPSFRRRPRCNSRSADKDVKTTGEAEKEEQDQNEEEKQALNSDVAAEPQSSSGTQ